MEREKKNNIISQINGKNLMKHVEYISSFDRESGTDGEKAAALYFKKVMEENNIPAKVHFIENLISLPKESHILTCDGEELASITHSYGLSTPKEGLKGKLVSLESGDLEGKIVVVNGLATHNLALKLMETKAAGAVCISANDYPYNMAISPIWGMPVPDTAHLLKTVPVVTVNRENGEKIKKILADNGEVTIFARVETKMTTVPLCIAQIDAKKKTDKFVMFDGHIDSWHRGATDNGTSNAAILEIARVLSENRDALKTNIRFIWWSGHSNGRYSGSNWYGDYNFKDIYENAVCNVNIDAIGAVGSTEYNRLECSAQCYDLGKEAIEKVANKPTAYYRICRNGDQSFWAHGVPSLFEILSLQPQDATGKETFVPGLPWFWHTTEDKFQYVSQEVLTKDAQIYMYALLELLTNNVYPFDFTTWGKEMLQHLENYKKESQGLFDIDDSVEKMKAICKYFEKIKEQTNLLNTSDKDDEKTDSLRNLMLKLNRILMPLHYCKSEIFYADLAVNYPPFPAIGDISKLKALDKDSWEFKFLERELVRGKNKINFNLDACLSLLKAYYN